MKTFTVFTGNSFTPLFKGAKAEVITLKGSDGGPQAIGQFYDERIAQKVAAYLNSEDKMRTVLYKLIDSLPELDSEDEPLEGSEAVSILAQLWDEIKESVK